MKKFLILFFIFLFLFSNSILSKESLPKYLLKKPKEWGKKELIKLSIVSSFTFLIYTQDEKIRDFVQDVRNETTDTISDYTTWFGDGYYVFPGTLSLYGIGYVVKSKRLKRVSISAFESALISGTISAVIKGIFHRHRPNTGDPYNTFDGPSFTSSNNSFPSGHTTVAFAVADSFAQEYSKTIVIPVISYALAFGVGYSRMNDDVHWASDVFLGAVIGIVTSRAIYHYNILEDKNISIFPSINKKGYSIVLSFNF